MHRKRFLKATALGVGAASFFPLLHACKSEAKEHLDQPSTPGPKTDPKLVQPPKIVKHSEGLKLNVIGDHQNIKLTGQDTNGKFTLIEQNNPPGVEIPPHVHTNEDEVFQVLEGQVEMMIGDDLTTLNAGDLIFCPKGIPHSWKVVGDKQARAMLSIFPAGLEDMFIALSELPPGPPDLEKVAAICADYKLRFV